MGRTSEDGYRCSAAHAFLAPALERANVSMATGVLCDEVMIEGGRAVGVRYPDSATGEIREVTEQLRSRLLIFQRLLLLRFPITPTAH